MAGNTKLRGFAEDNTIQLERWGERVSVKLPSEAVKELRKACFDVLPSKPPERPHGTTQNEFSAMYDGATGRVEVRMTPMVAKQLAELLQVGAANVKEQNAKLAEDCAFELEMGYQAHIDYLDENEPGVPR